MPIDAETFENRGEERYSIENDIISFLHDHRDEAFNVREIATAVMDPGWSETTVERSAEFEVYLGCFLDLATVSSIVDALVDNGALERRILDVEDGERSYYRAR